MQRDVPLQTFTDAALAAFQEVAHGPEARAALGRIATALSTPASRRERPGSRLPVCDHLDAALAIETGNVTLDRLIDAFRAIEPDLEWTRRASFDASASANFVDGHANAMILGPAGLENRRDVWFGVSLLAPHVRYTDHSHAPEEVYLVLSDGEFRQGDADWFTPGAGGSFYNPPLITHAMRSADTPLFAFWALWAQPET
jgi:hypothetical protein